MADIFLSYDSEDRERVRPLVEHLRSLGWSVWWDRELAAGPSFDTSIEEAIREASCVVVAWSERSIQSRWVRDEANEGLERKILVPFCLDDVRPPMGFRTSHTAKLIGWPERRAAAELNSLIGGIREIVGTTAHERTIIDPVISSNSLAVLRFVDMSPGRDQGHLCEGIAEEILNKLAQIRDLKVIARASSFQFDSNNASVRDIGRRLGVQHVLGGSVRTADRQIRIAAQLIECEAESHRWSKSYTRDISDIFALYDEIATEIGRELKLVVSGSDTRSVVSPPTRSFAAYNLLTQARFKFQERAQPRDAFPLVDQALELDPEYAAAHSFKSTLYRLQAHLGHAPARQAYMASRDAAERALELDPELVSAHFNMAVLHHRLDLDFRLAEASYRKAERLGGGQDEEWFDITGRYAEALEICLQKEVLDPANAMTKTFVGIALRNLGRMEEAARKHEEAFALGPRNNVVLVQLLYHYIYELKDLGQAALVIEESKGPQGVLRWARAAIELEQGDPRAMRNLVEAWVRDRNSRFVRAYLIANAYYRLGEYADYMHWFDIQVEELDQLSELPQFLRNNPDYWNKLREWAVSQPDELRNRLEMVDRHRARIDKITEKMFI